MSKNTTSMDEFTFRKGDIIEYGGCRWLLLADEQMTTIGGTGVGEGLARELQEANTIAEERELMPLLEPHIKVAKIQEGQPLPTKWEKTFLANEVRDAMTRQIRNGNTLFEK